MQLLPHALVPGSVDLGALWQQLLAGRLFIAESYCSQGRCYAVLEPGRGSKASGESVAILERFLLGERQKSMAIDRGLAVSTIASHCSSVLACFAYAANTSHAPILVGMAAYAAQGNVLPPAVVEAIEPSGRWLIHVRVPGLTFRDRLSPSELAVALLAIEGKNYTEMARSRRSSERTIANQLAACFRKLGISGRAELRAKAVQEQAQAQAGAIRDCA